MADSARYPRRPFTPSPSEATGERTLAYCQECGQALFSSTLRRTADGIFCPVCVAARAAGPGWQPVATGPARSVMPLHRQGRHDAGANPGLACMLGFIPGVGAMYNGQYAKGALHLIVFVVLVSLAGNLSDTAYWLVWGWVFYQAFDAYHTARAKRDGLPLPNPFGWNDIGERFGFHRSPPMPPPHPSYSNPVPPTSAAPRPGSPTEQAPWQVAGGNGSSPDGKPDLWADQLKGDITTEATRSSFQGQTDNPYTAPFTASAPMYDPPIAPQPSPIATVPYKSTYTGNLSGFAGAATLPTNPPRRFPVGAVWLIALGSVFLLGNLLPELRLSGRWIAPVLLASVSAWLTARRWQQFRTSALTIGASPNLAGVMTGPILLFTVAVLLVLQAGTFLTLRRTWPVLLVIWGCMQLAQRVGGSALPPVSFSDAGEPIPPSLQGNSDTGSLEF